MQKELILYIAQSLDGYIAHPNKSLDWLFPFDDESTGHRYTKFIKTVDTIIMGYSTYTQVIEELILDNWPYSAFNVYVVTHHKLDNPYGVNFYTGELKELVISLKKSSNSNIWLVGGSQIIAQCMSQNLIDRYIISIIPTILGEGIPLFSNLKNSVQLKKIGLFLLDKCVKCAYVNV